MRCDRPLCGHYTLLARASYTHTMQRESRAFNTYNVNIKKRLRFVCKTGQRHGKQSQSDRKNVLTLCAYSPWNFKLEDRDLINTFLEATAQIY